MTRRVPVIETELGLERLCRGCGEFWPDRDPEFWYLDRRGKVQGRCKACWSERYVDGKRQPFRRLVSA